MSAEPQDKPAPIQFQLAGALLSENTGSNDFGALLEPLAGGQAVSKVAALERMIQAVCADQNFKDFSQEILLAFLGAVPSEAGSILEFNPTHQEFFFRVAAGQISDRIGSFRIPKSEGIVWHVAESRMPCLVDSEHQNAKHLAWMSSQLGFEMRSMIAFPILVRGEVFAVVELLNRVGEPTFSGADQDVLTSLAQSAGKLIEARLMIGQIVRHQNAQGEAA